MPRSDIRGIRREQILQATEMLVAERGWQHATFAEICKAAGVSNRVLTYHFRDKDDILLALLEYTVTRLRGAVVAAIPTERTAAETLTAAVSTAIRLHESNKHILRLGLYFFGQAPLRPEIAERLRVLFLGSTARIAEILDRGIARGDVAAVDSEAAALAIQMTLLGAVMLQTALGLAVPEKQLVTLLRAFLERGGDLGGARGDAS
jgi:TetR/AcrR family transcriptional regulator, transcriptional repressor of bet genes